MALTQGTFDRSERKNIREMYAAESTRRSEMWDLGSLLEALPEAFLKGTGSVQVGGLAYDSRAVGNGDLFFCIKGHTTNGHMYAPQALEAGASAIVAEEFIETGGSPLIIVEDARDAMARLAAAFYGHPSRRLKVVALTGTNGKTTTSYMIKSVCETSGVKSGVLGTLGYLYPGFEQSGSHTTPEAPVFQRLLRSMVDEGVGCVAAEISSHALQLKRSAGTFFEAALFTNLSRDHLDFHGSFEAYRDAKLRLFLPGGPWEGGSPRWAILNADDPVSEYYAKATFAHRLTFGAGAGADVRAVGVAEDAAGTDLRVRYRDREFPVRVNVPGSFNVYNALAACSAGFVLGCEDGAIASGIKNVTNVPGRMERIECGQDFRIIVDYAHTPDALSNVLTALRSITPGRIICVFGCGGDRDQGKRPEMGSAVAAGADYAVVTSDNPRSEDPEEIIEQILGGFAAAGFAEYEVVPDRAEAIERAVATAVAGDTVLVAGKGHEDYQILGDRKIDFDDREIVKGALARLGHGSGPSDAN
jgi:UDP-N-acetylmuramoyl-L-alanyl-D-glutamate--2,6-diaminopimelate ligase